MMTMLRLYRNTAIYVAFVVTVLLALEILTALHKL